MEKTKKLLNIELLITLAVALIIITLFESDILISGAFATEKNIEFIFVGIMEIVTICLIPIALRLFRFSLIHHALTKNTERNYRIWGIVRMTMLCLPLIANTILYYLFMHVAFGYMGIILGLCLFFVYPSKNRCIAETTFDSNDK